MGLTQRTQGSRAMGREDPVIALHAPLPRRLPRLAGVDLARGLAVLFMIAVHVLMVYGNGELRGSVLGKVVEFLGGPPAAPVFMLLMGLSFAYAGKDDLWAGIRRGLLVLGSGYLLNVLRGVLPVLAAGLFAPELVGEALGEGVGLLDLLLIGDILQFAGLALMAMTLLRFLHASRAILVLLAVAVAGFAPLLWGIRSGFPPLDLLLDLLWGDRPLPGALENAVSFPVFPWLAFPLVGMVLGDTLRAAAGSEGVVGAGRVIRRAGLLGLAIGAAGLGLALTDPAWHFNDYYHARWGSMLFMVGFSLAWLALWDLAARRIPDNAVFRFLAACSRQVTVIYFLQWILVNWGMAALGANQLGAAGAAATYVAVTALSYAGAGLARRGPDASRKRDGGESRA